MRRILIIDDDTLFRQMLRQMLERAGYEVVEAEDGKKGTELFREAPTDLIITDIIMPEKEGIETIIELKREFAEVKIIALSGGGRLKAKECLNGAKGLGASHIFTKPFDRKELLEAIQELFGNVAVMDEDKRCDNCRFFSQHTSDNARCEIKDEQVRASRRCRNHTEKRKLK